MRRRRAARSACPSPAQCRCLGRAREGASGLGGKSRSGARRAGWRRTSQRRLVARPSAGGRLRRAACAHDARGAGSADGRGERCVRATTPRLRGRAARECRKAQRNRCAPPCAPRLTVWPARARGPTTAIERQGLPARLLRRAAARRVAARGSAAAALGPAAQRSAWRACPERRRRTAPECNCSVSLRRPCAAGRAPAEPPTRAPAGGARTAARPLRCDPSSSPAELGERALLPAPCSLCC